MGRSNDKSDSAGLAAVLALGLEESVSSGSAVNLYSRVARLVSNLALLVWGIEEVGTGANWLRRLLGIGGGTYAVIRLLQPAGSRRGRASAP